MAGAREIRIKRRDAWTRLDPRTGRLITCHAKKKRWRVKPTIYERRDVGYPGRGTPNKVFFVMDTSVKVPAGSTVIFIKKGALGDYSPKLSAEERREILRKIAKKDGALTVFRRLNVLRILWTTRRGGKRVPREGYEEHVRRLEADMEWLRREYGIGRED